MRLKQAVNEYLGLLHICMQAGMPKDSVRYEVVSNGLIAGVKNTVAGTGTRIAIAKRDGAWGPLANVRKVLHAAITRFEKLSEAERSAYVEREATIMAHRDSVLSNLRKRQVLGEHGLYEPPAPPTAAALDNASPEESTGA